MKIHPHLSVGDPWLLEKGLALKQILPELREKGYQVYVESKEGAFVEFEAFEELCLMLYLERKKNEQKKRGLFRRK